MSNTVIIALTGKGGVGKTSLCAAIVRLLTEKRPDAKILAIDADPAVGLMVSLGAKSTYTLDQIRKSVAEDVTGKLQDTQDILAEAKFRLLGAMEEQNGFCFLAIGRPEAAGCYCAINAYLKKVIEMVTDDFDYVIIDGEAGIEQVNRRVLEKVTHLICVSDQSKKGLGIIGTIKDVADELVMYDDIGLIINRAPRPELIEDEKVGGVRIVSVIPQDDSMTENDIEGKSIFELSSDAAILKGTKEALEKMNIL